MSAYDEIKEQYRKMRNPDCWQHRLFGYPEKPVIYKEIHQTQKSENDENSITSISLPANNVNARIHLHICDGMVTERYHKELL